MKKSFQLVGIFGLAAFMSCGGSSEQKSESVEFESQVVKEAVVVEDSPALLEDKGIGSVTLVVFDEAVNEELAKKGEVLYNQMCTACHKPDVKFIGPAQKGILDRRSPEWVMNMILNPQEMLEKNETAKALLVEYNNVPMTNMGLTEDQARSIVEYFRIL